MVFTRVTCCLFPALVFSLLLLLGTPTTCYSQLAPIQFYEDHQALRQSPWLAKDTAPPTYPDKRPLDFSKRETHKLENLSVTSLTEIVRNLEPRATEKRNGMAHKLQEEEPAYFQTNEWRVQIGTSLGMALDHLRWTIPHPGGTPNILSELTFRNIYSVIGRVDFQVAKAPWSLDAEASYGLIFEGEVRDDDFALDDRFGLFSRSENDATDHDLQSAAVFVGYDVHQVHNAKVRLLLGGRIYRQRLRFTNGNQVVPDFGPFPGLNSDYKASWFGPVVGAGIDAAIPWTSLYAHGYATFNPAWYWGWGSWNLREDLKHDPSFTHRGFGYGTTVLLKIAKYYGPLELHLGGRFLLYYAKDGTDNFRFANGEVLTRPFNEVITFSIALFFGASYVW